MLQFFRQFTIDNRCDMKFINKRKKNHKYINKMIVNILSHFLITEFVVLQQNQKL